MSLQYVGLNEINGPLVVLDHVKGASYDEMVEIQINDGTTRLGRVVQIEGERVVVQVFEGTNGLSLENTKTRLLGKPMELPVSKEILGRIFSGAGRPIDGLGEIYAEEQMDINGLPLNPVARVYPRNYINTGISSIDCLATLIRGQKLPIFSVSGLPHDRLAVQIVKQAKIADESGEGFAVVFAAMGQAFFTLSLGIGAIAIFGSYIDKERRLTGEAIQVVCLDTFVALVAGLIVIPACFAYGVNPGEGPGLVFVTLPNIFANMPMGQLWGALFFLFMAFAALTTIIAVFENILKMTEELTGWDRKKSVRISFILVFLLSLPCALGFNLFNFIQPFGTGTTIQDLEDFIVSNNLLPLGSMIYVLFCTSRYGWGWKNFLEEANTGEGIRFPKSIRFYVAYIIPLIILVIFIQGYWSKFF